MVRLASIALALAFCAGPALAVDLTEEAEITLWCGEAFSIVSSEIASDDADMSAELSKRGAELLATAREMLREAGMAEAEIETTLASYAETVAVQIAGEAEDAAFSYDDCMALTE